VAIGEPYVSYQKRLIKSAKEIMPHIDLLTWTDELPKGSKSYAESMYGFKMYAFQEAFNAGYDLVVWLDTPTVFHEDISFVFDLLEKSEHKTFAIATDVKLYKYINEQSLKYFGITRQEVKNKDWFLNYGFIFGFTKDSEIYQQMFECEKLGLFTTQEQDYQDHLNNSNKLFFGEYVEHRHEESIISMLIQKQNFKLSPNSVVMSKLEFQKTPLS